MEKRICLFLLLIGAIMLMGCGQEDTALTDSAGVIVKQEDSESMQDSAVVESKTLPTMRKPSAVKEKMQEDDEKAAIDYDFLVSEGYEILEKDITVAAGNVREHPLLKEYLREDIEFDEDFCNRFGSHPSTMEYFLYDINGNGVDDYIVCYYGVPYVGSAGNNLCIYIQEKDTLKMVFGVTAEVHLIGDDHAPIAILKDSEKGYHSLVLPYTNNRIWRYDNEEQRYCSD